MSKEPIIKPEHREVLKKMDDNVRMSREEAMKELGYSANYARTSHITQTDSWQRLMAEQITDEMLLKAEKDGLEANRVISAIKGIDANGGTTDFIEVPDHQTRHRFLETGLKMRGKIKDKSDGDKIVIINLSPDYANRYTINSGTEESSS